MPTKAHICDTCLFSREHLPMAGKLECHVRSVDSWPVRDPTEDCGEWRDPNVRELPSYLSRPRRLDLIRYINQLLAVKR